MIEVLPMPRKPQLPDDDRVYEMQVIICKAFAHPTRLKMLDILAAGECAVADLPARLKITAANTSQHLAILKAAGIVATRREGKAIYCLLAIPEVKTACSLIRGVLKSRLKKEHAVIH